MNDDDEKKNDEKKKQADLFNEARERRDLGIQRVGDKVGEAWQSMAAGLFLEYGKRVANGKPFLTEDAAAWAYTQGLAQPHKGQAWGPVVIRLKKLGRIRRAGFAPARTSNLGPKSTWIVVS